MLKGFVKPPFPNNELYDMKNEIKDLKDQLNLYKNEIDSLKVTSNIIVHNSSTNNEIKELKDQLELYKNKIDSLTDKKESTDINVFTKKIVGKQIVYKDIEEYVYDYSYMKSSREDLHKEIKTVYRIFQRMIQNKYIPEAILVVSTK